MPIVAVPVLAALVIALLAVLVLLAAEQLGKVLAQIVPSWHFPAFGSMRSWIITHIHEAVSAMISYLDPYVHEAVTFVTAPVMFARSMLNAVLAFEVATHLAFYRVFRYSIPLALSTARKYTLSIAGALQAQALSYYHQAIAWADAKVGAALATALGWYHAATGYALDLANTVQAQALSLFHITEADLAAAERATAAALASGIALEQRYALDLANAVQAQALSLFHAAEAEAARDLAVAKAFATATAKVEAAAAVAALNGVLATDIHLAWPAVVAGIDGVIDVAGDAFSDVVGDLRGIAREIPADLPAAIAATTAIAIPLLRLAKDCTMPNCRNLSQVGRDLQALFGLVETGGMLALLGQAARDPQGFAGEVRSVLGPIVDGAMTLARAETGAP